MARWTATALAVAMGRYARREQHDRPSEVIGGSVWEGAVRVSGSHSGSGYLELTGYGKKNQR